MSDPVPDRDGMFTRQEYLLVRVLAISEGTGGGITNIAMAMEAISSTALAHPEWDLDETKTWAEWASCDA